MPTIFKILAVASIFSCAACTGLFFNPDRNEYADPVNDGLIKEDIYFNSQDGTKLHGWHLKNKDAKKKNITLVQFHGNSENISSFYKAVGWMAHYGYDIFTFDYRGYGKSEGMASAEGIHQDGVAALKESLKLCGNGHKLVLFGQSLGGIILPHALTKVPEIKNCTLAVVLEGTFVDYKKIAREKLASVFLTWPLQWLSYLLITNEYSTIKDIPQISPATLLVIHGDRDITVPIHHGRQLFELAQSPKEFWQIPDGEHVDTFFRQDSNYRKKFVEWLGALESKKAL